MPLGLLAARFGVPLRTYIGEIARSLRSEYLWAQYVRGIRQSPKKIALGELGVLLQDLFWLHPVRSVLYVLARTMGAGSLGECA